MKEKRKRHYGAGGCSVSELLSLSRVTLQSTSGYPELSVYVNYAHGDEGPQSWYSSRKLDRRIALKKQWDPEGVISRYNPITYL
ncbi:hypothetical protein F4779DRAFT_609111 [Xylariaceae sp. FL0662B]|nr:hypothetical protein F4779DRAFT_609111 [Xylariaceae sp. FL0662B]